MDYVNKFEKIKWTTLHKKILSFHSNCFKTTVQNNFY